MFKGLETILETKPARGETAKTVSFLKGKNFKRANPRRVTAVRLE
jgi:hypothetical protein